jgi:hypothetical protein
MASKLEYANWLIENKAKRDSSDAAEREEFNTVASAYKALSLGESAPAQPKRAYAGYPIPYPGAISGAVSRETASAIGPDIVRYGIPLGIGIATAPISAPTLGAITITSGISALTTAAAETFAQIMEQFSGKRKDIEGREIGASFVSAAAVPLPLKDAAKLTKFLVNAGGFGVANETSRAIQKNEIEGLQFGSVSDVIESAGRVLIPAAVGGLAYKSRENIELANRVDERKVAVTAERMGGGFILADLDESFAKVERDAIAANSKKVRQLSENMGVRFGDAIRETFAGSPNPEVIAEALIPYQGKLTKLQNDANQARQVYEAARNSAQDAASVNASNAAKLNDQARIAGEEALAAEALYKKGLDRVFGPLGSDVNASQFVTDERVGRMQQHAENVKGSISSGIRKLYKNTGIDENNIVVNESKIGEWIDAKITDNTRRAQYKSYVDAALQEEGMKDANGNISLSAYRQLRDKIAKNLKAAGETPNAANKSASEAYEAVRSATEDFMLDAYPKDVVDRFKNANVATRGIYSARDGLTGAIDFAESGQFDKLVNLIEQKGWKQVSPEINSYIGAIRGLGDEASVAAAEQFTKDLSKSLRDVVIGESLIPGSGLLDRGFRAVDMKKLASRSSALVSDSGVPVDMLGLGSREQLNALARIASREGRKGFTPAELDNFYDDLSLIGYEKAIAKKDYEEGMKSFFTRTNKADRDAALRRAQEAERKGKLTFNDTQSAYERASADPLAVLLNDRSFNINTDPTKNGGLIGALLNVGETDLKNLMRTLRSADRATVNAVGETEVLRRSKLADDIQKATTSEMMFKPLKSAMGEKGQAVDLTGITNLFYGEGNKNFKAIIGDDAFNNLKNTWGKPAADMLEKRISLGLPAFTSREDMIASIAAVGLASGKTTGGVVVGQGIGRIAGLLARGRNSLLHLMFVMPETSMIFRELNYNVDKFMSMSTRNAILVQFAEREDNEKEQQMLQKQYLTQPQPTR